MPDELLRTKLFIPSPRLDFVPRPRLIQRLAAGLQGKLTLLSAPAGFGKTTLLSEVISTLNHTVAWVSLDKEDNDPVRFWSYFIAAIQTVHAGVGKNALSALQASQIPHIESILTSLINETAEMPEDINIVLDDYHMIEAEPVQSATAFLLEHMPSQMHLVIATRSDPPFPLPLLRGRGQLTELRTADLRFTIDETTAFLKKTMNLELSEENVTTLEDRTEGWIASLQMAAISMQGRNDVSEFVSAFSGTDHYIMDYLADEVLDRQEERIQSFLLKTSILDRLSGPLCNDVIGQDNSQEMLDRLQAINLFLVPLDGEGKWFRYHHLFADLLRDHLTKAFSDSVTSELHLRASKWFEREALMNEAIHHALEVNDFERAANLIETIAMPMLLKGKLSPFQGWLDRLPYEMITAHPWLCLGCAIINLSAGRLDAGKSYLQMLESTLSDAEEACLSETTPDHNSIRSLVMSIHAIMPSGKGDTKRTIELCQEAFKYLPEDDPTIHSMFAFHLGVAHGIRGELNSASHYLAEADTYGQSAGNFYIALIAIGCMAEIQSRHGQLHRAAETNHRALELGVEKSGGGSLPATGLAQMNLARIHYQWNDLDTAIHHATNAVELAEQAGESISLLASCLTLARIFWARGQMEAMAETLDRARQIVSSCNNTMVSTVADAWVARLSLAQGDLTAVERWAATLQIDLNLHEIPDFWCELPYLTFVRLMIAKGELDEVPDVLERLCQRAMSEGQMETVIEVLTLQSIALHAQGKEDQALNVLNHALSLAEPEGYIRSFTDEGDRINKLLRMAAARGIAPNYVNQLLSAMDSHVGRSTVMPLASSRIHDLPEPLTERELEVLRFVAGAMSNYEIAKILVIEESTVKSHMNHILGKLRAKNRLQAVERARSLGLL